MEFELILVYICIMVIARFTFFPFSKVNGEIQPLIFESAKAFPFRINRKYNNVYPVRNCLPIVYKGLNTNKKVIAAGVGFSLCVEILQLPFYDRVTDIDDLILNGIGFLLGYAYFFL